MMTAHAPIGRTTLAGGDGIIIYLFYGEIRRLDPGLRAGARRARVVPRGVPRLVVSLAARDQRSASHLDGDPAQRAHGLLRDVGHAGIDRRVSRAVLHRPQRRRVGDTAIPSRASRESDGDLPAVRAHGGAHPRTPPAAG